VLTKDQIKAGRALLRWSARELGERAGVRTETILRLESGALDLDQSKFITVKNIRAALESGGVEVLDDGGVRMRQP
jgi:predicted transcriptional regulator